MQYLLLYSYLTFQYLDQIRRKVFLSFCWASFSVGEVGAIAPVILKKIQLFHKSDIYSFKGE